MKKNSLVSYQLNQTIFGKISTTNTNFRIVLYPLFTFSKHDFEPDQGNSTMSLSKMSIL